VDFSDFGAGVSVTAPPADQVAADKSKPAKPSPAVKPSSK
jgi:hypothetical protein